ncbi:MAG: ABC transporter ATP-binding protein [Clostridiales bacterium]|nr:ABC transporter ATP-binding protein [Clostridium sp. N3C]NLZ49242.1 ABC transporter ATP-binding protein [Clostridiales bacterium]SCN24784.1 Daunorubicin/doxorubicin resistance ATP-binding protein DrrA [Clostridium sp. N3C]
MKIVSIEGLRKKFKQVTAVNNLSLSIYEGEIYGLLGPNGAGKSTTINIISGLLEKDGGSVRIFDKDIDKDFSNIKRNIGIVPQDLAIYEDLTAFENVSFFASLYGLKGRKLKEAVVQALDFVGLTQKAKEFPKRYSGGMKRRLNIACAIAHRPRLIIMDEPTVGIDPQSRNHILQSVKQLNSMGCTIIYTSHYMDEVEEICSRIGIIDHGKLIAEGRKEELTSTITEVSNFLITVSSTREINQDEMKAIPGVIATSIKGNNIGISSWKKQNNLNNILDYLMKRNIKINNIQSKVPDLETVFLNLTGRNLRD